MRQRVQEALQLRRGVTRRLVQVENLADFVESEPQALAPHGELQARALAPVINALAPGRPFALRRQQALVLVETDRTRRHVELAGEIGDGVGWRGWRVWHGGPVKK